MSGPAGTLITTHNAFFWPPSMAPGFQGHIPGLKFTYGETYGVSTSRYFQDYRNRSLDTSKSVFNKGGAFPTIYTHDPAQVISARDRSYRRVLDVPHYQLNNVDRDRKAHLRGFYHLAQDHRDFYRDRTGCLDRVREFVIPTELREIYRRYGGGMQENEAIPPTRTDDID